MFELTVITRDPATTVAVEAPEDQQVGVGAAEPGGSGRTRLHWEVLPTRPVQLRLDGWAFTFRPGEVTADYPILLAGVEAVVTTGDDQRDYTDIVVETGGRSGRRALQLIDEADENSYSAAAERNRQLKSPTWLGLGRDLRTFGFSLHGIGAGSAPERMWDWIAPQWHGEGVELTESDGQPVRYQFMIGRGIGPREDTTRRLRAGTLPILEALISDGGIDYELTTFATLERRPLTDDTNPGSNYLRADGHSVGHMFTEDQQAEFDRLDAAADPPEETVLFLRIRATNNDIVPRFAFLKAPAPFVVGSRHVSLASEYQPATGAATLGPDRVYLTATMDGAPLPHEETSRLVQPGQTAVFDLRVPHRPISAERAEALRNRPYQEALEECQAYWQHKLEAAAGVDLPEPRISAMVAAGLLHLDLVAYGDEPDGTLAPTIGIYAPIGSESAPIIQFFDSIGRPDLARRSLQYFLDKQHENGFMQNFGGYMLETEAALWSFGEHYRYTRDNDWVREILPGIDKAVGYIVSNRHQQQAAGADPYGLIIGKTADPEDPFAAFMLNGYAYLGLSRAAEMVAEVDPERSKSWGAEAESLRADIRGAFEQAVGESPVVPLGDGHWVRTAPPWPGQPGPLALDDSDERWFTHGAAMVRDSLIGPLWLIFQEVLDPSEPLSTDLLDYHAELFHQDNTAFSQPYYSPHPLVHLRRNEVKRFLAPYYTMVASLADPETYSFWEHYFHASPHKTHEEAWFLMQTRWMLYLEDGSDLRLLPGIPRAWLAPGEELHLKGVRSYFGSVDLDVVVSPDGDTMSVAVGCDADRAPSQIAIRLPHPSGRKALGTTAGSYSAELETVVVEPGDGSITFELSF